MDELELLKKDWQSREQELPKLSYSDIYQMLLKKSSSIVKWIFYISIAEIIFWTLLAVVIPNVSENFKISNRINDAMGLHNILIVLNIINYLVFGAFIYLFYKNHRSVKVTDSVKQLMKNILKTRKTVKYFVIYNVGATTLIMLAINIYYYINQEQLYALMVQNFDGYSAISQEGFASVFFLAQFIFGLLFIGLILLFYRIVYGILLRRLKKNYKELKKIEV
ncbi:hypothetical protein [Marixanthomonas spongiae]|uniref:Uncharacterized protein n=1 Tax=Marixanthomonas spongiae TaxID=2174845 RepID=A0A2U0HYK7_9FLAO|nr:hypothetical protein [Marixanthomonas spongiae]PVW13953.1 hypothetical protein DDV96_12475 [Marixanthomonas spongiae]